MESIYLCDVRIDCVTMEDAVNLALEKRGTPCTVFTPNAVMLGDCIKHSAYVKTLNSATVSLPDGSGVLLAAKRRGTPIPARVAGIDFGMELCRAAAERGFRVFLLGGREGIASRAAENLKKEIPGLSVCGTYHGYFDRNGNENTTVLEKINRSKADILFVCFGFPIQEEWTLENLSALSSLQTIACLGGSLDVWSGTLKRAPMFFQKHHLEWLWRMLCEPRRARNVLKMGRFFVRSFW